MSGIQPESKFGFSHHILKNSPLGAIIDEI